MCIFWWNIVGIQETIGTKAQVNLHFNFWNLNICLIIIPYLIFFFFISICNSLAKLRKAVPLWTTYINALHTIYLVYGNTGCGVSSLGLWNSIDFWLKVKCFKGLFDIFWKFNDIEQTKFGPITDIYASSKLTYIKSTNNESL